MAINRSLPLLRTVSLEHRYGDRVALHDLNLTVHAGEVFGYIGPNGAGKTTTFRILSGLITPTGGKAFVTEQDVTHDKTRLKHLIGYLPDNFGVYRTLQVWEYLDFFAAAYQISKKLRPERIETCLQIAGAKEFRDKFMGALSRGMKQRVGIAKTLLHDPQVLILDASRCDSFCAHSPIWAKPYWSVATSCRSWLMCATPSESYQPDD
jgi:ABC-2 type transport system ATP-binding protein